MARLKAKEQGIKLIDRSNSRTLKKTRAHTKSQLLNIKLKIKSEDKDTLLTLGIHHAVWVIRVLFNFYQNFTFFTVAFNTVSTRRRQHIIMVVLRNRLS